MLLIENQVVDLRMPSNAARRASVPETHVLHAGTHFGAQEDLSANPPSCRLRAL